jgi:hypothetical protein
MVIAATIASVKLSTSIPLTNRSLIIDTYVFAC